MTASFELRHEGDVQFNQFLDCAHQVHYWLLLHDNWESPLLPKATGCPALEYEEGSFQDEGHKWHCISPLP